MSKNIVFTVIVLTVLVLVSFFTFQRIDRYLELKAISDCASDYRIEFTDVEKNTKIIRPLEEPFKECVWNKKVKNWQGTNE